MSRALARGLKRGRTSVGCAKGLALGAALGLAASGQAQGAEPARRWRLSPDTIERTLIALALQAKISIGGDIGRCEGRTSGLDARLTLDEALSRVLAGGPCAHRFIDRDAVLIFPRRPAASARPAADLPAPVAQLVVTAAHQSQLPSRAPQAVWAAGGSRLEALRIDSLSELSLGLAGWATANPGPGRAKIQLRGIGDGAFTGQAQSAVALFLGDAPITYNAPDPDLRLADLDRVEVLKGPQGTLYGAGGVGGVVRLVPAQPDPGRLEAQVVVEASSLKGGSQGRAGEVMINLPLAKDRLAVRGVAYDEQIAGWVEDVARGQGDVNRGSRRGGRAAIAAHLSPDWSLTISGAIQTLDMQDSSYGLKRLSGRKASRSPEPHHNSFDQGAAALRGEGEWGEATLTVSQVGHVFRSRYDIGQASPFGLDRGTLEEARSADLSALEAVWSTRPSPGSRLLAGVFASRSSTRLEALLKDDRGAARYGEQRTERVVDAALFGEAQFDLDPQLSALVGGRLYTTDRKVRSNGALAGERDLALAGASTGSLAKLMISWSPRSDLLVYGLGSQGYRPGGYNTAGRGTGLDPSPAQPRRYGADKVDNLELGVKGQGLGGGLVYGAALYLTSWSDVQLDRRDEDGLGRTINAGDAIVRGAEIEAAWRIDDRLSLEFSTSLLDVDLKLRSDLRDGRSLALSGAPQSAADLSASYRRPLTPKLDLATRLDLRLAGRGRLSYLAGAEDTTKPTLLAGAAVGLEQDRWSLTVFIDNLFDTQVSAYAFGRPYQDEPTLTSPAPRRLGARLRLRR